MASYISSSNLPVPHLRWTWIFCSALLMVLAYVGASEFFLAAKGFAATARDSEGRWLMERKRAASLGGDALILVGASRIQLGLDLKVLRQRTGREPVQLAIDGSSYVPVLQGLARDPEISGTVVVDIMPGPVGFGGENTGASAHFQAAYDAQQTSQFHWPTYLTVENWLADTARRHFINYADGARPLDSLVNRLLNAIATPQYLVTYPDRSRRADYQLVKMPDFYLSRVLRHIGNPKSIDINQPTEQLMRNIELYIAKINPESEAIQTQGGLNDLEAAVATIQARGGQVIFLVMPTSGLILAADSKRFPRAAYWDKLVSTTTAKTVHWQDHPELSGFTCPDGSHLDKRDINAFTNAIIEVAGLRMQ